MAVNKRKAGMPVSIRLDVELLADAVRRTCARGSVCEVRSSVPIGDVVDVESLGPQNQFYAGVYVLAGESVQNVTILSGPYEVDYDSPESRRDRPWGHSFAGEADAFYEVSNELFALPIDRDAGYCHRCGVRLWERRNNGLYVAKARAFIPSLFVHATTTTLLLRKRREEGLCDSV